MTRCADCRAELDRVRAATLDEISTLITQAKLATSDPAKALLAVDIAVLRLRNAIKDPAAGGTGRIG